MSLLLNFSPVFFNDDLVAVAVAFSFFVCQVPEYMPCVRVFKHYATWCIVLRSIGGALIILSHYEILKVFMNFINTELITDQYEENISMQKMSTRSLINVTLSSPCGLYVIKSVSI